ncbi:MAG: tetratricopeptide repeat protein [Bacteroidia bacterium]|nr:tetratricopeptide repeat protein [Bacteroidia bacterium]
MAKKATKKSQVEDVDLEYEEVEGKEQKSIEEIISDNRNLILGIVGGILLIVLGFIGFRLLKSSQDTEAQELMVEAPYYFEADSLSKALEGDNDNLGFIDIADEFGGTKSANQANYYSGIISLKQGNPDAAIEYLNKVSTTNTLLDPMKHIALANSYAALGDFGAAGKNFEKASRLPKETDYSTPYLLLKAGEAYELAGDNKKALSLYKSIQKSFPKAAEEVNIEKYLARMGE